MKIENHSLVLSGYDRYTLEHSASAIMDLVNLANEYDYTLDYLISLILENYRSNKKEIPETIYLD